MDNDFIRRPRRKESDSSKKRIILISLISIAVIGIIILLLSLIKVNFDEEEVDFLAVDSTSVIETKPVSLFFVSRDGMTYRTENTEIVVSEDICKELESVIIELIEGPSSDSLYCSIPKSSEINAIYIDNSGILFIDFSESFLSNHCQGTSCEVATIKTLLKTTAFNFSEISQLQILVEGKPVDTIGGHLDVSRPFYVIDWI